MGKELRVYGAPHLFVSPVAGRKGWVDKDTKIVYPKYRVGTRHKMQTLAILAEKMGSQKYKVWGPVMLSASGYQVSFTQKATREWAKYTKPAREELAAELGWSQPPAASLFWMPLGQFGKAPQIEMVGKSAQSPITPIHTYTTEEPLSLKILKALYIGGDAQAQALAVLDAHEEYLAAWKDGFVPEQDDVEDEDTEGAF